jgi:hypothetical protein
VVALRIGMEPSVLARVRLRDGEQRELDAVLAEIPMRLADVRTRATARCAMRPNDGSTVAQLFLQARTALLLSRLRGQDGAVTARYEVRSARSNARGQPIGTPVNRRRLPSIAQPAGHHSNPWRRVAGSRLERTSADRLRGRRAGAVDCTSERWRHHRLYPLRRRDLVRSRMGHTHAHGRECDASQPVLESEQGRARLRHGYRHANRLWCDAQAATRQCAPLRDRGRALVRATWVDQLRSPGGISVWRTEAREAFAHTDTSGRDLLCNLPRERPIRITVTKAGGTEGDAGRSTLRLRRESTTATLDFPTRK